MNNIKRAISVIRFTDKAVSTAFLAALLLILAFASYAQFSSYRTNREADSLNFTAYKPDELANYSFNELKTRNPDVIGWLTIDGTKIDYPLVKGSSNTTYISKSVFGDYSLSGSIFMDVRNDKNFNDMLTILYGHHMADDVMFGCFDKFADNDFFEMHRTGNLFFDNQNHPLTIFAYMEADGYDTKLYDPKSDNLGAWAEYIKSISKIYSADVPESGKILLMSTCASGETNGRMLLAAKIGDGEPVRNSSGVLTGAIEVSLWMIAIIMTLVILVKLMIQFIKNRKRGGEMKHQKKDTKITADKHSLLYDLRSLGIKIGAIITAFVLLELFVFGIFVNSGEAMSPNINDGDIIITFRMDKSYVARDVILYKDNDGTTRTGRVVASEGDTVEISDKGLKINGYLQQENYAIGETTAFVEGVDFPVTLGKDELFILGDNREKSKDSRIFGVISKGQTLGRVITTIRQRGF